MSVPVDPSAAPDAAWRADAGAGRRSGRERQLPDDGFWRDVFEQAQAVAQRGRSTEPAPGGGAGTPGHGADDAARPAAAAGSSAPAPLAGHPADASAPRLATGQAVRPPVRDAFGSPTAAVWTPGAAAGDAGEPAATQAAARGAPMPARGQRPAEIAATVMLAADGERRVYLRGALDEREALELAARVAAAQGGAADAVSVRLNGRLLYRTEAAASGPHTLPGRAYADIARAAAADQTDHVDHVDHIDQE